MYSSREFFLLNLVFPVADTLMGTCAMKWYKRINNMEKWSNEMVLEWQNVELMKFIQHAYDNTSYYKRVFDERGLKPSDIKSKDDLPKLPIVDKAIVNKHFNEFVPKNIRNIKYRKARTGGTTGEPMNYYCDENTWGYVTAAKIVSWKKLGYRYGDKFVALGSASLFSDKKSFVRRSYDNMRRGIALNGMSITDEICEKYIDIIKGRKVKYLYGYAASIYLFSKYVHENNIDLTQIQGVFTTSEKLTEEYRKLISSTYDCSVMDCYGAKDAGITAYEILPKQYHVGYNAIVEIINPINDYTGSLVTTNFVNYSFPLIRYEFDDVAELIPNSDKYNGQVIKQIIGRESDVMRLENGNNVTGPGFTVLIKPFDIFAYEIRKIGNLEVELKIQPNPDKYSLSQEALLRTTILKYLGKECKLNIVYVEKFEPLKNGKRRYFIIES